MNRLILPGNLMHFIVQFKSYHGLKYLISYHDYMISIIRLHPLYISFSHDAINSTYDFPQIYQFPHTNIYAQSVLKGSSGSPA